MRRARFVLASLLIIPFLAWITGFAPSGSFVAIHAPTDEQAHISFGGLHLTLPQNDGVLAFPVGYGKATLRVTLSGKRVAWIEFFNADVGARHKIDIYLSQVPDSDLMNVREVVNGSREIFNDNVNISKTSPERPYIPGWY